MPTKTNTASFDDVRKAVSIDEMKAVSTAVLAAFADRMTFENRAAPTTRPSRAS